MSTASYVGDGFYMMADSELATAVMRRVPFTVVLTDNRGYGLHQPTAARMRRRRVQQHVQGQQRRGAARDRLRRPCGLEGRPRREGGGHRRPRGKIAGTRSRGIPTVIVIDTEAVSGTGVGGHWWDVAVPEVGGPERLEKARDRYAR